MAGEYIPYHGVMAIENGSNTLALTKKAYITKKMRAKEDKRREKLVAKTYIDSNSTEWREA